MVDKHIPRTRHSDGAPSHLGVSKGNIVYLDLVSNAMIAPTVSFPVVQTTVAASSDGRAFSRSLSGKHAELKRSAVFGNHQLLAKCGKTPRSYVSQKKNATVAGNPNEGKGIFAPVVVVARNILGKKRFNQLRGKGIALHSQVITEFCKNIGAEAKQKQGLIRLAKKNGEKLGFLA